MLALYNKCACRIKSYNNTKNILDKYNLHNENESELAMKEVYALGWRFDQDISKNWLPDCWEFDTDWLS